MEPQPPKEPEVKKEWPKYTPPENITPPVLKDSPAIDSEEKRLEEIKVASSLALLSADLSTKALIPGFSLPEDIVTCIEALPPSPKQIAGDSLALNMLASALYQTIFCLGSTKVDTEIVKQYLAIEKIDAYETYSQSYGRLMNTWQVDLPNATPEFLKHVILPQIPQ